MPADRLKSLLKKTGLPSLKTEDCSIVEISPTDVLISNIDIFTAIHDDPYTMGKIAACNVTNDLFALNALEITNYSNFMGMPHDTPDDYYEKIIYGIQDFLKPLGARIEGGHTIINPWPLFGGSANTVMKKKHLIKKHGAKSGDAIILTKPLGIQPVMGAYRVLNSDPSLLDGIDLKILEYSIDTAVSLMTTSNHPVCEVIHELRYFSQVHAMTDITGFGFKGHLQEILEDTTLGAIIHKFPVIEQSIELAELMGYPLLEGNSSEISGGMLMTVEQSILQDLEQAFRDRGILYYYVGTITSDTTKIEFSDSCLPITVQIK